MIHRLAWFALSCLLFLVVAGAIVRVTGSGLGCPDWPTCWGCLLPPTSADQIDVDRLDLEKFKTHAKRKGIDPDTITRETVLDSFDPLHTWIEFSNRLATMPLGFATLLLAGISFTARRNRGWLIGLSLFSLIDVIVNAVMGAIVVRSGLQPGIITLHMALAFLLIIVLVSVIWLSRPPLATDSPSSASSRGLKVVSVLFFLCLFSEGLMGSQLREQTDEMQMNERDREQWNEKLEVTTIYKVHRSFSWSLLVLSVLLYRGVRREGAQRSFEPGLILLMVIAMMVMGIILGHLEILRVVQVLHVGMTGVLLAVSWHWLMRLFSSAEGAGSRELPTGDPG